MNDRRVVLGLSGGVDSAVAARLLQRDGFEVLGLYLDVGGDAARADAIATAEFLGVPLTVLDVRGELERCVCAPFADSYRRGETPNPCVMCNPSVKFRFLAEHADRVDAQYIATGHYARAEAGRLFKGMPSNDQSYMLCRLTRAQARRLLLPLGGYEKPQVRAMAAEFGVPVANKPDSMEICFIPDKDYVGWLERRGCAPGPGRITFHGEIIGEHEGIHRWTVGQRLPGLYRERKLYVAGIDAAANELIAVLWEELFKTEVRLREVSWLIEPPLEPVRGSVRVRHTKWENPDCTILPDGGGAIVHCDSPVRAPAPGQAAALYQGDRLIGGGWIAGSAEQTVRLKRRADMEVHPMQHDSCPTVPGADPMDCACGLRIRELRPEEVPLLETFLYEAIFQRDPDHPLPRDVIRRPELWMYVDGFGSRRGDCCLCAEENGRVIGAVWTRIIPGYGHVDDGAPEFAISLLPDARGRGVGTQLMRAMLAELPKRGFTRATLAAQKDNYALKMYRSVGFTVVGENDEEFIMEWRL